MELLRVMWKRGGLVSEGVNRYVTAPEALCAQVGRMLIAQKYHFRHHLALLPLAKRISNGKV